MGLAARSPAQSSITVTPLKTNLTIGPGNFTQKQFLVTNNSDEPANITVYAADVIVSANGTTQYELLPESKKSTSPARWLSFENKTVTLKAKERKKISYKCKVPNSTRAGTYHAVIFAEEQKKTKTKGTANIGVGGRIGIITNITVPEEAKVKINSVTVPRLVGPNGIILKATMTNTGSILFRPKGKIIIRDLSGKKVETIKLPWTQLGFGRKKQIEVTWKKSPWFGYYTANITLNDGGTQPPEKISKKFFIFPWKISLGLVALISILIFYGFYRKIKKSRTA